MIGRPVFGPGAVNERRAARYLPDRPLCIFTGAEAVEGRLCTWARHLCSDSPWPSPFTVFGEDRLRLGWVKP